jgi:hypothetical protein
LLLFFAAACKNSVIEEKPQPFADISKLVENEIIVRQASRQNAIKVLTINGKSDTQILEASRWQEDTNFWEKEFAVFYSFEAKPSWAKQFKCDSSITLYPPLIKKATYIYSRKDEAIPVRAAEIRKHNGVTEYVTLSISNEKDLYNSEREVLFIPGRMIKVISHRKSIVEAEQDIEYTIFFER